MTRDQIERILAAQSDAWNSHDAAALSAGHAENSVYTSMWAGVVEGRDAIEKMLDDWFFAFPDMQYEVDEYIIDRNTVAVFWSQCGTHTGEFSGLAATGRKFQLLGVFLMTFQNGKIVRQKSIYDFTGLLMQIGVLKAKPAA